MIRIFIAAAALLFVALPGFAQTTTSHPKRDRPIPWIERPWEFRYAIKVENTSELVRTMIADRRAKDIKEGDRATFGGISAIVTNPTVISPPSKETEKFRDRIYISVINFDKNGWVIGGKTNPAKPLRGRLQETLSVVLSEERQEANRAHFIGKWFQGFENSDMWAPALCLGADMAPITLEDTEGYRYGKLFRPKPYSLTGAFGCREWAYQLRDPQRPYIDVTHYQPKTKEGPANTYIREFIGFARFGDNKPVIGSHEGQWYCLHDCPGGEQPGEIKDIKAWAAKQGWAPPQRPKRQPMFPDSLYIKKDGSVED